jgi:ADP-ribose pyrophosphatase
MTSTTTLWRGRFLEIRVEDHWEYAARPANMGAAIIIPIDDAADGQHVILISEYRIPLGRRCIAFPAGMIGDDDSSEDAMTAAARELEEEAGYVASSWRSLGSFASSPGLTNETVTIFEARGLTQISGGGGVAGEDISVHRVAMADVSRFLEEQRAMGCAVDVKLLAVLGLALSR